jgi:hypothetical protein
MTAAVSYCYGTRDEIDTADPDVVFETIMDLTQTLVSHRIRWRRE